MHAHDVVNYAQCRRKDYYSRVKGWSAPSLGSNVEVGSMFHAGLCARYRAGLEPGDFSSFELVTNGFVRQRMNEGVIIDSQDVTLANDMLNFYWDNFGFAETSAIKRVLAVEDELELVLSELDVAITCRPDLIFERMDGLTVLRDHKTKDKLPSDYSWFDMDLQMKIYQLVCRQYGWSPAEVQHNLVRREVPPGVGSRPLYNEGIDKNGKAYRRKSTASTEPSDYVRIFAFRKSEETLRAYQQELFGYVYEMLDKDLYRPQRSPGQLCNFCQYSVICNRESAGETVSDAEVDLLFSQSHLPVYTI